MKLISFISELIIFSLFTELIEHRSEKLQNTVAIFPLKLQFLCKKQFFHVNDESLLKFYKALLM